MGDATAEYNMGVAYARGQGVPQDYQQAADWLRKAAEHGVADAEFALGVAYANGQGLPQDDSKAVMWWTKAAEHRTAMAENNLGAAYYHGRGVPQDYGEAAKWYREAAEQGVVLAQNSLGGLYGHGDGVTKDAVLAYMLFDLAAMGGDRDGSTNLKALEGILSPAQIAEGRSLAAHWKAGTPLPNHRPAQKGGQSLGIMAYVCLGIALGLLTGWAFLASRFHTRLSRSGTFGQKTIGLVNNIASILLAVAGWFVAFSFMLADSNYSGTRLILLLVVWLATTLAVTLWRRGRDRVMGDTPAAG